MSLDFDADLSCVTFYRRGSRSHTRSKTVAEVLHQLPKIQDVNVKENVKNNFNP